MGWGAALDTAIGLVLTYVVLSLVCTVVNEYIATWLNLRAKTLASSLESLLDVPMLKADFFNHGLIDGAKSTSGGGLGSYLPGRNFAMALFGALDPTKPIPGFADIKQAVGNLPDSNIRDALLAHLATAEGDVEQLRDSVAQWYDEAMDRLSGVYKRKLKVIAICVGLGVAVILNADTVAVTRALWTDDALRTQMADAANALAKDPDFLAAVTKAKQEQAGGTAEVGGSAVVQAFRGAQDQLRPLPLGWPYFLHPADGAALGTLDWFSKAVGLALTALALSLGAPFWFDLLAKFMNIRGAGPKPKPTAEIAASER
jgi:hypothetical protein